MALKLVLFVSVMTAALALPVAKAQSSIRIVAGVVFQVEPSFVPGSINGSLGVNVTATPGFLSKFAQNLLQLVQCTMTTHISLS